MSNTMQHHFCLSLHPSVNKKYLSIRPVFIPASSKACQPGHCGYHAGMGNRIIRFFPVFSNDNKILKNFLKIILKKNFLQSFYEKRKKTEKRENPVSHPCMVRGGRHMGQIGGRVFFNIIFTYFPPKKFKSGLKKLFRLIFCIFVP